ncbi:NAD-dependent epimerase/dehydratase family protein [Streptomyces axinellae]|uniref:NAD-dependent epimerase/dehydratase family protein n=1 Tax=Streptomyces axinellae TaxID=552788 RepID=UPI0031D1E6DE
MRCTVPAKVLVTGGAGFTGSRTRCELLQRGHEVVVADDSSDSLPQALECIAEFAGNSPHSGG